MKSKREVAELTEDKWVGMTRGGAFKREKYQLKHENGLNEVTKAAWQQVPGRNVTSAGKVRNCRLWKRLRVVENASRCFWWVWKNGLNCKSSLRMKLVSQLNL